MNVPWVPCAPMHVSLYEMSLSTRCHCGVMGIFKNTSQFLFTSVEPLSSLRLQRKKPARSSSLPVPNVATAFGT
ncbi:hypothetical protein [Bartonella sp. TT121SHDZB]|uniref:hypothetical protein n=1 Tax=Bartonella sp. TT121SHDZB TaxID=3243580 RepID=UPI0035CE998D